MRAIDLYRERGDGPGLAEAVLGATRIIAPPHRIAALLEEALAAVEGAHPHLEDLLIAAIGLNALYFRRSNLDVLIARGTMLAEEHDLADAQALLIYAQGCVDLSAGEFFDGVARCEEAFTRLDRLGQTRAAIAAKATESGALMYAGDTDRAQAANATFLEYAQSKRLPEWRDTALAGVVPCTSLTPPSARLMRPQPT